MKRLEIGAGALDQRNQLDEMLLCLFKPLANIASKKLYDKVNLSLHKYRKPATSIPCIQDHPACMPLTLQYNTKLTKLASPPEHAYTKLTSLAPLIQIRVLDKTSLRHMMLASLGQAHPVRVTTLTHPIPTVSRYLA
jgi:hypothetical protein